MNERLAKIARTSDCAETSIVTPESNPSTVKFDSVTGADTTSAKFVDDLQPLLTTYACSNLLRTLQALNSPKTEIRASESALAASAWLL